jgi:uncharacterized protein involved in outer membrane biogenesis
MRKTLRRIGFGLAALAAAFIIFVLAVDLNRFKPEVESRASWLVEDKVRINGDVEGGFVGWRPALMMHDVEMGEDLRAETVLLTFRLAPGAIVRAKGLRFKNYLFGDFTIPVSAGTNGFELRPVKGGRDGAVLSASVSYAGSSLLIEGEVEDIPLRLLDEKAEGKVEGKFALAAEGENGDSLMRTLKGRFLLTSGAGRLTSKSLNFWSRSLITSLLLPIKKDETKLNCAIADFTIDKGVAQSRAIIVDTSENTVFGKGKINLVKGTMDMLLKPSPKDLTLFDVATPVRISGPLENPVIAPQAGGMAKKLGGMFLTVVNPALAIIPLMESGFGEYKGSCSEILERKAGR